MENSLQRNKIIQQWLDNNCVSMQETADFIFHHPELSLNEKESSRCLAAFLEKNGFAITWGISGFETAFVAEWEADSRFSGFWQSMMHYQGWGRNCVVGRSRPVDRDMDVDIICWEQLVRELLVR